MFIVIPVLLLIILSSYFISSRVFKSMKRQNRAAAWWVSGLVFVLSIAVLSIVTILIYLSNVRIER